MRRLAILLSVSTSLVLVSPSISRADNSGLQDYFQNFSTKYFSVDLSSGTAQTSVPVVVPQGRKGIAPQVALGYSSAGKSGWVGVGWTLGLGSIERSAKKGVPSYEDGKDIFAMSFQGSSSELIDAGGEYKMKVEGAFMRIRRVGDVWEVRDKGGTKYLFGSATGVQKNKQGIFRWHLDKVVDYHGNSMDFEYEEDAGALYLSRIRYVGNEVTGEAPTHAVEFVTEEKPDWTISYVSGARVEHRRRLREIEVRVQGALVRRYRLKYRQTETSGRSLLEAVEQYGADGVSQMPTVRFTYNDAWRGWQADSEKTYTLPDGDFVAAGTGLDMGRRLADVDSDGRTDVLVGKNDNMRIHLNKRDGWEQSSEWKLPAGPFVSDQGNQGRRLADINGDGLIDVLVGKRLGHDEEKGAYLNTGNGWGPLDTRWNTPDGIFVENGGTWVAGWPMSTQTAYRIILWPPMATRRPTSTRGQAGNETTHGSCPMVLLSTGAETRAGSWQTSTATA